MAAGQNGFMLTQGSFCLTPLIKLNNITCFQVPDYLEVIDEPMDLTTIMHKIDCHQYSTCEQFLADVDLITSNALKYNPDRDPMDKLIRHRACELSDMAHSEIKSQLEPEFEKVRDVQ